MQDYTRNQKAAKQQMSTIQSSIWVKALPCSTMDASIACKKMRKSTVIYCFAVSTYLWVYCPMLHGQK